MMHRTMYGTMMYRMVVYRTMMYRMVNGMMDGLAMHLGHRDAGHKKEKGKQ